MFDELKALMKEPTSIAGASLLAGDFTAWLLEQVTWRQAIAAAVPGIFLIVFRQAMPPGSSVITAAKSLAPVLLLSAALFALAACAGFGDGGGPTGTGTGTTPAPTSTQLINGAAGVAQVADIVADDVPTILAMAGVSGATSTTITNAASAVSTAAAGVAQSGLNLSSAQGIASAVNALIAAAEADPQVSSNSKVMTDLQLAQLTIGGVVAIWDVASAAKN
jgi:hypothetical protein